MPQNRAKGRLMSAKSAWASLSLDAESSLALNSPYGFKVRLTAIEWGIDQSSLKQMWAQSSEPQLNCGEPKFVLNS